MSELVEVMLPKEIMDQLGFKPGHTVKAVKKVDVEYVFQVDPDE